jgi:hypothetical protein
MAGFAEVDSWAVRSLSLDVDVTDQDPVAV